MPMKENQVMKNILKLICSVGCDELEYEKVQTSLYVTERKNKNNQTTLKNKIHESIIIWGNCYLSVGDNGESQILNIN